MNDVYSSDDFGRFVDAMEASFDSFVEHGSDQELFLAGYLHGHFSLVVSEAELATDFSVDNLQVRMQASLSEAYQKKELSTDDQQQANDMLLDLWREQSTFIA